jgi:hypothetical protein
MQSHGAIEAENRHDCRADSDIVVARDKGEQRDEERINQADKTASRKASGCWISAIANDLSRFQRNHHEEQPDQRPGGL